MPRPTCRAIPLIRLVAPSIALATWGSDGASGTMRVTGATVNVAVAAPGSASSGADAEPQHDMSIEMEGAIARGQGS